MWSVWYVVSRGGGGGGGCRETTIAPVLPAVTQRTFEMNYFIADCAVPSLCGLQLDKDSPTLQTTNTERQDWDWDMNTEHSPPTWCQQCMLRCWDVLSPSWIPSRAFSVCPIVPIYKLLNSNQTRRLLGLQTDASWTQWAWCESTHCWQSVSGCVLYLSSDYNSRNWLLFFVTVYCSEASTTIIIEME